MNLRTLLVWGMSASLLAACSGGNSSVLGNGGAQPGVASLQIDASQAQSTERSPKFVGASVNTVAYSFTPGPITGSVALSSCPESGSVYTCTVSLVPNTYALTVTLEHNSTAVGSASATGIVVTAGATTPVTLTVSPVNTGPSLSVPANSQFYVDGTSQTITAAVNELDPAGDIISTYFGPVTNWPTLTLTGGGTTGVTINGGTGTISTPPSAQTGDTVPLVYNGTGVDASSFTLKVSDGTTTTPTIALPFISLTGNMTSYNFTQSGAAGSVNLTFTESASTGGSPVFDTKVFSSTTCGNSVTFTPALVGAGPGNPLTADAITINAAATGAGGTCTLYVASPQDPNLVDQVTLTSSGLGIGLH